MVQPIALSKRWPQAQIVTDVRNVDSEMVHQWLLQFPMVEEIHLWAGFPCTDLFRVRAFRQGLRGPASSLVFEIPRIEDLLRGAFGNQVLVKRVIENVSSMDKSACEEVSQIFHTWPYELDPVDSVPMRRPRFTWCSEPLEGALEGLTLTQHQYWRRVHAETPYPSVDQWVEPHWEWAGGPLCPLV